MNQGSTLIDEFKERIIYSRNTLIHLIATNVGLFLLLGLTRVFLSLFNADEGVYKSIFLIFSMPANPADLLLRPWTFITYMFTHQGFLHILFNMLIFYWFGQVFREYLGDRKLLAVYLVGGLSGALIYFLAYQIFPLLSSFYPEWGMVGASASVLAILVATATLIPDYRFNLLLFGPVKIKYIALVLIILDLLQLAGTNSGGHFAHLGGAIFGFIYINQVRNGRDIARWSLDVVDWFNVLFKKKEKKSGFKVHKNDKSKSSQSSSTIVPQEEIDRILDKIASSGYDSLSDEERNTLFKASKK